MAGCRKAVLSGQVEEAHGAGTPGPLFCREMILIIHGFPSDIIALQFEWAWQNPGKSRRLRHVASKKTKEIALKFCFRVLAEMLNVGPWNRLPLTIRWLKQEYKMEFDADRQPPKHMPIAYGPLNKRKAKKGSKGDMEEAKDVTDYKCVECFKKIKDPDDCISCLLANCPMKAHLICLAKRFLMENGDTSCLIPIDGDCPTCYHTFLWRDWLKYRHQTDQEASQTNLDNPHWAEALHQ